MAITEIIELGINTKGIADGIKSAGNMLAKFTKNAYAATVTADTSDAEEKIGGVNDLVEGLQDSNINVDASTQSAVKNLNALDKQIRGLDDADIQVSADTKGAQQDVTNLVNTVKNLDDADIQVNADTTKATSVVNKLSGDIRSIQGADIPITVDEGDAVRSIDKVEGDLNGLPSSMTIDLDADESKALSGVGSVKSAVNSIKDFTVNIGANVKDALTGIRSVKKELDDVQDTSINLDTTNANANLGNLANTAKSKLSPSLGAAGALGAVGLLGAGIAALASRGVELEKTFTNLQAKTGATSAEMDVLRQSSENAFRRGLGDSLQEAVGYIATAEQQLGLFLDAKGIEEFTVKAAGIAQVFDKDVNEVISSSRTFIANFGLEGEEAANLIAAAMQGAGSRMDDVNDTLDEYSQLMKGAGVSAEQFVGILTTGIQAGVRDTDKLADAIKEAQIRINAGDFAAPIRDLSKTVTGEAASIVSNIEGILKDAQAGNISIIDAVGLSSQAIQEGVDAGAISTQLQNQLNIAISGTQAEDIGAELYTRVFSANIDEGAVLEKANEAGQLIENAIAPKGFEGLKRQLSLVLDDLSTSILPALQPVFELVSTSLVPLLQSLFTSITPVIQTLTQQLGPILSQIFDTLTPVIEEVFDALMPVVEAFGDLATTVIPPLLQALTPLFAVLTPIAGVLGKLAGAIGNNIKALVIALVPAIEKLVPVVVDLVDLFAQLAGEYLEQMAPLAAELAGIFGELLANAVILVVDVLTMLGSVLGNLLKAIFGGETAMDGFKNAFSTFIGVAKTGASVLTSIAGVIVDVVGGIADFVGWVGEALGLLPEKQFEAPINPNYVNDMQAASYETGFFKDSFLSFDETAQNVANNDNLTPTTQRIQSLGGASKEAAPSLEDLIKNLAQLAIAGKDSTDGYKQLYQEVVNQTRATNEYNDAVKNIKDQINVKLQFEAQAPLDIAQISNTIYREMTDNLKVDPIVPIIDAKKSLDEYSDYYTNIQETTRNLALQYQQEISENGISERKKDLDQQQSDIEDQLKKGEITYEEASKRQTEIAREQAEIEKTIAADKWGAIGQIATDALSGQFDILAEQSRTALDKIYADAADFGKQFGAYGGTAADELINSFEYLSANSDKILGEMGSQFGATFAGMVANGEDAIAALGKSALLTVIDNAEKMILANLPVIFSFLSGLLPPPFGQIVAGGLIATAMAMLSTAKAKIGAFTGGEITKGFNNPAHPTRDTIPMWAEPGEFYVQKRFAQPNKDLLKYINDGGDPEKYFSARYGNKMQKNEKIVRTSRYDRQAITEFKTMNQRLASVEKKLDSATLVKGYYTHKTEVKQTIKQEMKSESYRF